MDVTGEGSSARTDPMPSGGTGLSYIRSFDGLRAIAVLAVIASHAWPGALPGGYIGVDVFFVLSGFLITRILTAEFRSSGRIGLAGFYRRRALRLLPALAALLAVIVMYVELFHPAARATTLAGILPTILYVNNWAHALHGTDFGLLNHLWSLSVEEQFYIAWPLILWLALRAVPPRVLAVTCVFAWFLIGTVSIGATHLGLDGHRLYYGTDFRAATLLLGAGVALYPGLGRKLTESQRQVALAAALLMLAVVAARAGDGDPAMLAFGVFSLVGLASAVVVAHLVVDPVSRLSSVLSRPALVWIGRRSYGVYLWQYPVNWVIGSSLPHGPLRLVVASALSIGVAAVSWSFLEARIVTRYRTHPVGASR